MKFKNMLNEMDLTNVKTEKFDKSELIRAIRTAQISELDAVNTYTQIAQSTSDKKIKKLLIDIAGEEKVHFGELQKALEYLNSDDESPNNKGKKEAEKGLK